MLYRYGHVTAPYNLYYYYYCYYLTQSEDCPIKVIILTSAGRCVSSPAAFKRHLKTFLYNHAFNLHC